MNVTFPLDLVFSIVNWINLEDTPSFLFINVHQFNEIKPKPTPILQKPSSQSMNLQDSLWGHRGSLGKDMKFNGSFKDFVWEIRHEREVDCWTFCYNFMTKNPKS